MRKLLSCLTAFALLALAVPCFAGEREGAVTVSPFVGGYTFDGAEHLETRPTVGLRLGYDITKNWAVEATFNYINTRFHEGPGDVNVYNYRLEGIYNFMPESSLVPYLALGGGGETLDLPDNVIFKRKHNTYPTANVGGGIKWFLSEDVAIRADYHQNFVINTNGGSGRFEKLDYVTNYEYTVGLQMLFGGAKPAPAPVAAPAPPPPPPAPVEEEAPPAPAPAAAPAPGHYKYCVTLHMEYDICSANIRPEYHDEVAKVGDFMKKYPDTTAVIEGYTDNVPVTARCQYKDNTALSQARAEKAVDYLVEKFGIDRSRLTAKGYGSENPVADNATDVGKQKNRRIEAIIDCTFLPQEVKAPERLCIQMQMEFDSGKADIKPQYRDEIAKVGDYMKKYPETTAVIEGHTDNVGGYDYNMKLSQKRAENVVNYLVENFGIDRSRLSAKGYGYTRRIAYNNTPEGRQKNRRIDAIIDCVIKK